MKQTLRLTMLAALIITVLCVLQSCGSYHRIGTGSNVSAPVPAPAGTVPQS